MENGWNIAKQAFLQYFGSGWYFYFLTAALLYVTLQKHTRKQAGFLAYTTLFMMGIFFLPPIVNILERLMQGGVYWRVFWALPILPLIAYAVTDSVWRRKEWFLRILVCGMLFGMVAAGGKWIYTKENYAKAENMYKIPDQAAGVGELIIADGARGRAIVHPDLIVYLRQYSADVTMLYGRRGYTDGMRKVIEALQQEPVHTRYLERIARSYSCAYIVIKSDASCIQEPESLGWRLLGDTGMYRVYAREI